MSAHDDAFVSEHEPLVRKLAHRVRGQLGLRTDIEELIAYGFQGLVEARERFDPTRGVQFKTFAYYRVRGAIMDGVRQMAYLPRKVHVRRKAAEALDREAEGVHAQRTASPEQRSDVTATLSAIDGILTKTCAAYLIASVGQDREPDDPEDAAIAEEDRLRVRAALEVLDERERTLVEGYYFQDRTLESMSQEMGITKSWASRVCSRALSRMREALESG